MNRWLTKLSDYLCKSTDITDALDLTTDEVSVLSVNFDEQTNFFGLSLLELQRLAGAEWVSLCNDENQLKAFAHAIHCQRQKEVGIIPKHYTSITTCKHCGPVHVPLGLELNGHVDGCPWCRNNAYGYPIPKALINNKLEENLYGS